MKNGVKLLLYWGAYVLICLLFIETGYGQSRSLVTGTVVNETNKPLAGVTVNADENGNQAQRQTTATDANGMFRFTDLKVGIPYNLSFTYLGYHPQELPEFIVKSGDNNSVLIRMKISKATNLSEVVVVGYGTQKKQNITGSIATVKAEDLTDVASPNVGSLLQGKVAGLEVSNSSGQPGAMPKVKVRGISSISASQVPIWVVDGVIQHDVPNLNPQDIESISVLKDAASAALYGSRGANGVIVVTTKAAKAGITTVNFSGKTGISVFNTGQFNVMNSQQLYDFWSAFPNTKDIPSWFNSSLTDVNTDWIAMGTQHGVVQDYNLSVSGGTDKTRVYAAGNYFQEKGTVKGMVYDRFTGRLNLDQKLGDKITFSPKLFASYTKTDNRQHDINALFTYLPWDRPYDDKGNVINAQAAGSGWRGRDLSNYYYDLQWNYTQGNRYNAMVNLDFSYKILPFLEFKSTNNLTYLVDKGLIYTDPQSISGLADNGRIKNSNAYRTTRFSNQMLTFNKTFGLHSLNALAAYEYNDYKYDDNSATGIGIVSGITVLSGASKASGVTGTANHYAFQSMLMNANYSYDDRYVLQASFRRDGSSRFGSNTKYGNFFSFSGAWNIHREAFFDSSTVNFLRLKAAYGGVGNTPETLYPQYELFSVNAQYNGTPTVFPSALGNKNLTWEKSYSTNIGVETGLFDRLNLTLELYRKNTSDLLHFVPLPDVSGYKGYWDNIGRVMNKGAELTIDAKLVRGAAFSWDLGFNLGINRNKVMELYGGSRQINGNQVIEEGNDINTWYMRKWMGVNAENGTPQWEIIDNKTGEKSLTGNYAAASLQKVGRATPDYFGGISTKMNYNHFYLTANMAFTKGIQVYNAGRELFDSDGAYATYNQMDLKSGWSRWTADHTNATHPQALFGGNNRSNGTSSRYLEDGSYLRLRNVTLGYKWTGKMLERLKVKGINTNISIDNIFTITNYSGIDPEAAASGGTTSPYPLPKRIMFGLDIQF
ncbi:SusC/RagA family TonB-linked outer membrane protein [Sphingobacterium sp.]|uniref:SusC/RagA family TonB-linked outer membrane protein n=1 Tax=Sphingobacterium sp. TaxID=341027 RepID=UPI00258C7E7C|nr:SusC/RagA family TonB-linked outer membrane protein [Sphingobacterium sp.]WET67134.1 MAG: SusC/RagA family TonB-linked outer membrane protein [Sphingobacterium sp.]